MPGWLLSGCFYSFEQNSTNFQKTDLAHLQQNLKHFDVLQPFLQLHTWGPSFTESTSKTNATTPNASAQQPPRPGLKTQQAKAAASQRTAQDDKGGTAK